MSAFGDEKANNIVGRVLQAMQVMPFDFLKRADATQIITFIQNEHPQTIALILAYLQPAQAAAIMSGLPQDLRADVARRIATLDKTPPEVIREVEHDLAAQTVLGRRHRLHPRGRRQVAGGSPQLGGPLHREDDSGVALREQPGDRRGGQEADVRVRGHRAARRPRDPAGAQGSGHQGTVAGPARRRRDACRRASSRTCPSGRPA